MTVLEQIVAQYMTEVSQGLNTDRGTQSDLSSSNQCGLLTACVWQRLTNSGLVVNRELHQDENGNWHYLLRHAGSEQVPKENDIMSDLNPWQFDGSKGSGILHGPRSEIMDALASKEAPDFFVALRGLDTITALHDMRENPFRPQQLLAS